MVEIEGVSFGGVVPLIVTLAVPVGSGAIDVAVASEIQKLEPAPPVLSRRALALTSAARAARQDASR